MDLQEKLMTVLTEEKIDACIHAMAVSDYMVHRVTTLDKLMGTEDPEHAQDLSGNKISSDIDDLIIHMKRSPKVISGIKQASPDTLLVGFKLLSGVPHEELIDVGYRLLQKNNCDFVMANDLREIGRDFHKGYLIHKDKSYDSMNTNEEIAQMIVRRVLEERKGK
jgi:phosphopantothenate-cysteine ligase